MYGATLGVIADWVRALNLPVQLLQPRGVDAHEAALTVRMVQQALRCRRVIAIGGGLEGYLDALRRILRPAHIPIMELAEIVEGHSHHDSLLNHAHTRHPHAPASLHLWLDVKRAYTSCEHIFNWAQADGLAGAPVRSGWRRTQLRFRQLQGAIENLRPLVQGKAYIAVHDAYRPLTETLGMRSLGSLQPDEETPPNLQKLREVIQRARREPVLFVLSHTERGVGATLARILKIPLVLADTLEQVEPRRDYFQRFLDLLASLEAGARARV
ncbi:MAG: metal ABC transporter substrate-binding protein [Fimbriimonadales bacterium]|jgi:ABC-type Zn2+ transport system substrate-binding protein/surface adhesin|nr:metal ABC transporter substrate-binding protein [Fimbriimonadales bacterium]GIV14494.1 MAG: ABC transporter substrate-binding protein [Fimbriimonadales bacterium]CUU06104.1 ABC-type Zn uptake system ZnuABC, Zn-binding component ZnuA [Armatimonadetes bacterium GBS]